LGRDSFSGDRLFVYGSLRSDVPRSMSHLLGSGATLVGRARMPGRLYHLGAYPAAVASTDPDAWIHGEVYALTHSEDTLLRLDAYEGCGPSDPKPHPYERVACDVTLESGVTTRAWVYLYRRSLAGVPEILSGDYRDRDDSG
jgi:gamma-glutamylcyclotransferase (GGCT)/AIG2-like uncharacterized protein YtfP